MGTFLSELKFVVIVLVGFGLAGGWAILPYGRRLRYGILAAPLAGLLSVVLGTATLYTIGDLSLRLSAVLSGGCFTLFTLVVLVVGGVPRFGPRSLWPLGMLLAVAVVITLTVDAATIRAGGPALLYTDGTDHLGYAQLSDWLANHPILMAPKASAQKPEPAWAEFIFRLDPRFGSFHFLAIIQSLRGRSGAFSYDSACSVALCAGILAVAGVFARSWQSLLLLVGGLVVSCWFDHSRCGYLAKILGYPSTLLVLGLFFALPQAAPPRLLAVLVVMAGATSIVFPGVASATLIGATALPYLLLVRRGERLNRAALLALLVVVCGLTSGLPARPVYVLPSRDAGPTWQYLFPRILDLENQGTFLSGMSPAILAAAIVTAASIWAILILIAVLTRDPTALALLAGPFVLLLSLMPAGERLPVLQLIGIIYPFSLCGAAHLIDELTEGLPEPTPGRAVVLTLAGLMIALRVPRYIGAVERYAGSKVHPGWVFSKHDTNRLLRAIRRRPVLVDISNANRAVFVVTELGRRDLALRWTPRTWRALFGYTDLQLPSYPMPAPLKLVSADEPDVTSPVVYQTANLKLLDQSGTNRP